MNRSTPDVVVLILAVTVAFVVSTATLAILANLFIHPDSQVGAAGQAIGTLVNVLVGALVGYIAGKKVGSNGS